MTKILAAFSYTSDIKAALDALARWKSISVEICIDCTDAETTIRSVAAAKAGGARRVELCSRMDVGGLTPPAYLVAEARQVWGQNRPGLLAMIRPRPGNFTYSKDEAALMAEQYDLLAEAGADGFVLGAVRRGKLDKSVMFPLVEMILGDEFSCTCHRAFDAAFNPEAALDLVEELGMHRVLTSGTPWGSGLGVEKGVDQLIKLRRQAKPWIEIVLGGGVDAATIGPILAQLPLDAGPISVHAYSSVLRDGITDEGAVAELVAVANQAARDWMGCNP
ncbi:MAG: hypothetical protein KA003_17850 [Caldilineaceae bacterium]|nr:hypothetical protein [Caldilineaceae bacterium]MBP8124783.1 hypothetical protein [Caldilineaceae bacterium]